MGVEDGEEGRRVLNLNQLKKKNRVSASPPIDRLCLLFKYHALYRPPAFPLLEAGRLGGAISILYNQPHGQMDKIDGQDR